MKTAIVFVLLFTIVYCHPVKRSASSSESSEEQTVVKQPPLVMQKAPGKAAQEVPAQAMKATGLDENSDDSDEDEEADTDSDTDSTDTQEGDTDSSESDETRETESTSPPPETAEPTQGPVVDNGRGDSMGHPVDYKKTIIYMDGIEKGPSHYKTYGSDQMEGKNSMSKKSPLYDGQDANDVEKHLKVYKALQVHNEVLEGDTSTPEENQGLEATSGTENEEPSNRQAALGEGASPAEPEESASDHESASSSISQEEETGEKSDSSQSSEEVTATPGAVDESESSESQESDSDEQTVEATSESPDVIIAK